jgi:putative hydrolases of HD superfamily
VTETRAALFEFIRFSARLREISRHNEAVPGRRESVAEHSWHLALVCWVLQAEFEREFGTSVDLGRMIKMCLMHDLVEIDTDDVSAWQAERYAGRAAAEDAAARRIFATLPGELAAEFLGLWEEYEAGATLEARLVRGVDRLNPALMRQLTGQGWSDVDASAADLDALQLPRVGVSATLTELYRSIRRDAVAAGLLAD